MSIFQRIFDNDDTYKKLKKLDLLLAKELKNLAQIRNDFLLKSDLVNTLSNHLQKLTKDKSFGAIAKKAIESVKRELEKIKRVIDVDLSKEKKSERYDFKIMRILSSIVKDEKSQVLKNEDVSIVNLLKEFHAELKKLRIIYIKQLEFLHKSDDTILNEIKHVQALHATLKEEQQIISSLLPEGHELETKVKIREVKEKKSEEVKEIEGKDEIAKVMNDAIQRVKNHPEVDQAALKIVIDQMYQIAEQMREVREANHFQRLQRMMIEHWIRLKEMTKDHPELLKELEDWKSKFINNKKLMMEMINGLKSEITDKTQIVQEKWQDMQIKMGIVEGIMTRREGPGSYCGTVHAWFKIGYHSQFVGRTGPEWYEPGAGLIDFIDNCNRVTTGFNLVDVAIPNFSVDKFLELFNTGLREATEATVRKNRFKEVEKYLEQLSEMNKKLSSSVKDVIKIFAQIKVIRDTKMIVNY